MCLAVPLKIESIDPEGATVTLDGNSTVVSLAAVPEARVGDWVLVHAGMAITVLDEREARETFELLAEVLGPDLRGEAPKA